MDEWHKSKKQKQQHCFIFCKTTLTCRLNLMQEAVRSSQVSTSCSFCIIQICICMHECMHNTIYIFSHTFAILPALYKWCFQANFAQLFSICIITPLFWRDLEKVATVNPNAWVWQELELHRASLLFHCIALYCIVLHCKSLLLHYCQPYFARSAALPLLASRISVHTCVLYQISRRVAGTKVCNCFSIGESRMHTVRVAV